MAVPAFPLLVITLLLLPVYGVLHQDTSSVPLIEWDYIVVGGGTSGSVIANRLSEIARLNVLPIEAGPDTVDVDSISIPFLAADKLPQHAVQLELYDYIATWVQQPSDPIPERSWARRIERKSTG
ncbi:hypothetical protein BDV98DRAFT_273450 [Pterulicium gracile]|uniref:Uncharacterized protein n=1 Tax=Pterulicium gracile TaxID=1884261 RepID=A0A5C3Q7K7_9AGAR|nr:hypothetical protein BDV98DRAFT_273450 [Pterula gracilis]